MTENVQTAMFEIMKKIQADMAAFRVETNMRFDAIDRRFEEGREILNKHRRDIAGLLVMTKSTSGQLADELAAIDDRVRVLEERGL
jgi:DNA repair ATPase RecN